MFWVYLAGAIIIGLAAFSLLLYGLIRWLGRREPYSAFMRLRTRRKLSFFRSILSDRRVPLYVKAIPIALVVYLSIPFDIIPDFIPVLGYLDDVAIALLALVVLIKLSPRPVLLELLDRAQQMDAPAQSGELVTPPGDRPLTDLEAEHTPQAIRQRLLGGPDSSDLRDFIFGAIDGTVTTFAVVSGVSGAGLAPGIVIILGAANLVADGFSMGVSNFLGSRAEQQQRDRVRREEERQLRDIPEGEKEEIRQIFAGKGFSGADLERVVEVITSDPDRWLNTMLREEHGFPAAEVSPWRAGLVTFFGFAVAGLVPLMSYIFLPLIPVGSVDRFTWSIVMSAATFLAIGVAKARFVEQRWYQGGLETLALGGGAAGLAYLVGALLRGAGDFL